MTDPCMNGFEPKNSDYNYGKSATNIEQFFSKLLKVKEYIQKVNVAGHQDKEFAPTFDSIISAINKLTTTENIKTFRLSKYNTENIWALEIEDANNDVYGLNYQDGNGKLSSDGDLHTFTEYGRNNGRIYFTIKKENKDSFNKMITTVFGDNSNLEYKDVSSSSGSNRIGQKCTSDQPFIKVTINSSAYISKNINLNLLLLSLASKYHHVDAHYANIGKIEKKLVSLKKNGLINSNLTEENNVLKFMVGHKENDTESGDMVGEGNNPYILLADHYNRMLNRTKNTQGSKIQFNKIIDKLNERNHNMYYFPIGIYPGTFVGSGTENNNYNINFYISQIMKYYKFEGSGEGYNIKEIQEDYSPDNFKSLEKIYTKIKEPFFISLVDYLFKFGLLKKENRTEDEQTNDLSIIKDVGGNFNKLYNIKGTEEGEEGLPQIGKTYTFELKADKLKYLTILFYMYKKLNNGKVTLTCEWKNIKYDIVVEMCNFIPEIFDLGDIDKYTKDFIKDKITKNATENTINKLYLPLRNTITKGLIPFYNFVIDKYDSPPGGQPSQECITHPTFPLSPVGQSKGGSRFRKNIRKSRRRRSQKKSRRGRISQRKSRRRRSQRKSRRRSQRK